MRYYNYLNEEKDLNEFIINHPLTKLYEQTGKIFYRGTSNIVSIYMIKSRRKGRFPKDTDYDMHKMFDNAFNKRFGWKVRSEGVFVTSNMVDADFFGRPHIFLPYSSNYSFVYSKTIKDLTSQTNKHHYNKKLLNPEEANMLENPNHYEPIEVDVVIDKLINTYTDKDIKSALNSDSEVVFNIDKYLLINIKHYNEILGKVGFLKKRK
jgi:hypothetical protein